MELSRSNESYLNFSTQNHEGRQLYINGLNGRYCLEVCIPSKEHANGFSRQLGHAVDIFSVIDAFDIADLETLDLIVMKLWTLDSITAEMLEAYTSHRVGQDNAL